MELRPHYERYIDLFKEFERSSELLANSMQHQHQQKQNKRAEQVRQSAQVAEEEKSGMSVHVSDGQQQQVQPVASRISSSSGDASQPEVSSSIGSQGSASSAAARTSSALPPSANEHDRQAAATGTVFPQVQQQISGAGARKRLEEILKCK